MTTEDRLPLEIARRIADGESVDVSADRDRLDPEIARGLEKLRKLLGGGGEAPPDATPTASFGEPTRQQTPPGPTGDRRIAGFRLVRKLGEGGMGVVWEAEQDRPRRRVALKVIRGGAYVEAATLKLFQREVQTLARLQHPGIAALYASGATDDGLHWFAMELVRGATLQEWLRSRPKGPVTPHELKLRLRVFRKVCDAVAYAHQRGVIHRDLKPANVLVPADDKARPTAVPDVKVLDFGLARITESDTGMTSYHTEIGRVRGTLPYMSPEQVLGNPVNIDLRTDVYALGVLLYEMVTGKLPLDLARGSLIDAMRVICEEPPRSISATFTGTRRLDPDVATIVGKALEKDAERRYATAAALGEDVDRWLNDQPIQGRPPSATYQFRKLVARHKLPFAFAGAVFVLLAVLAGAMTVQAARIARERDRANQEAKHAEEEAKRATEEAATAKSVSDFLEGMFKDADPAESRGATITAKEILDRGAAKIQEELADQPIVQMRLLTTVAAVYDRLGLYDVRARVLDSTLPMIERYPDRIETADLLGSLAGSRYGTPAAVDFAKRSLEIRERLLPATDPRIARGLYALGNAYTGLWRLGDAESAFKTGLARLDAADRDDPELRVFLLNDMALNRFHAGELETACDYMKQALRARERTYPPDHPERLFGEQSAAYCDVFLGNTDAARPVLARVSREGERVWSHALPKLAYIYQSQAECERRDGHFELARSLAERSRRLLPDETNTAITLAYSEEALGRSRRAVQILETAIKKAEARLEPEHPELLTLLVALSNVRSRSSHPTEAAAISARAARIREAYQLPATAGTLF